MAPGNQYASSFVEVMGRVGEDGSLEEIQSFDLGDNFGKWDAVVVVHSRDGSGCLRRCVSWGRWLTSPKHTRFCDRPRELPADARARGGDVPAPLLAAGVKGLEVIEEACDD